MTESKGGQEKTIDPSSIRKSVSSGFAWQGATKVVVQLTSWIATLFVARIIAPAEYGMVAAAAIFIDILLLLTDMGLAHGLIQKTEVSREEEDGIFYISLVLGILGYLIMFTAAPLIAAFYEMPLLTDLLRVFSISLILGSMKTVPLAIAMRRMDFRYRSLVEMSAHLMMTLTVITLALAGFGVWSLAWSPVVSSVVMAIGYLPLLGRVPRLKFPLGEVIATISFGIKYMNTALLYSGWNWAPTVIIGKVLGDRLLGYYSIAFQLAALPLDKVAYVFNQVMFPALSRLKEDQEKSGELFLELHRYLLCICYPIVFGMAAVADDGIRLLLTDKWAPIVPYLQVLCLVSALRLSAVPMPAALFARGKPEIVMRYNFLSLVVLPVSFYAGARLAGLEGVVIAWLLAYPLLFVYLGQRCIKDLSISWKALAVSGAPAAFAATIMVFVVVFVREAMHDVSVPIRFGCSVMAGAAIYLGILFWFFREKVKGIKNRLILLRHREVSNS